MKLPGLIATLPLAVTLLIAFDVHATQVFHVPVEDMAVQSEVIVHARVVGQRVILDPQQRPATLTDVEILNVYKGAIEVGAPKTIFQLGGSVDGRHLRVPGALHFDAGEEIIFFAVQFRDMLASFGMGQGKFLVERRDGTAFVGPEFGDVSWVQRQGQRWVAAGRPEIKPRTLQSFETIVRAALKAAPKRLPQNGEGDR